MKRLIVLGSTGMLGSEIVRVASEANVPLIEVSRSKGILFDAEKTTFSSLAKELTLSENDWLVNCIGWIPQKATGETQKDEEQAWTLNALLPAQISDSKKHFGFGWIQIGTDCVFSGATGSYSESSPFDASDLYGTSKIEGEKMSEGDIRIRCSVIGRDKQSSSGLYEWFRSQSNSETVNGFTNHIWNGVSTTAFARLVVGLFQAGEKETFTHHWIPLGVVSKYELLRIFAKKLELQVSIRAFETEQYIDRTLITSDTERNLRLWRLADYEEIPSIEALCQEFISRDKKLGL